MITTAQALYEATARQQAKQGWRRAVSDDGDQQCRYRTAAGDGCAIGCHMGRRYRRAFEGKDLTRGGPMIPRILRAAQIAPELLGVALTLQNAHDGTDEATWREAFYVSARTTGLKVRAIKAAEVQS